MLPVTALWLDHSVSDTTVPSGVPAPDERFGMRGFYQGSGVLITGTAGTAKTTSKVWGSTS